VEAEAVELPELAKPPASAGGCSKMMISSLSRTERAANFRRIFKLKQDLNQSELDLHADMCMAGANTEVTVMEFTDTKVNVSPITDT
jgi:hypothetical protein